MKIIRPDYIFSYWIFIWYILYILKFAHNSPKFALIVGIIENLFVMFTMIHKNIKAHCIIFFIINIFIKVLPLLSIINDKILQKDIYATVILFLSYNIWLYINKTNLIRIYYLINSKNYRSPISFYLINIFDKYF